MKYTIHIQKMLFLLLVSLFIFTQSSFAQNTIGLLSYNPNKAFDGYNLVYPHNQPNVYLLNNCGEIVNVWEDDSSYRPGNIAYLTADGLLYKGKRSSTVVNDDIWAGGGGSLLEIRDWDNNLVWSYELNNDTTRLHHDFTITPDGNIIALAWELKTIDDCLAAGRDTSTLAQGELWPDWLFEINPSTNEIVWEWHAWDHLVQDFDPSKDNFGSIEDNPELIDVNYGRVDGHPDWLHGNSLDYNEELDQVMISIPYFDEVWIIDHTTTTQEAASHVGGFGNRGGDLMFRWGNPITSDNGDSTDQKLFFQHDAHWIDDFLDVSHPYYGKVAVFNNRVGSDFSTANIFTPAWEMYDWAYLQDDNVFLPNSFDLTIMHPTPTDLYSNGLSSIQVLPNGNFLITSGRFGYTFELTPDNEIVWEYKTPFIGPNPATQGDTLVINNNITFRMKRYPANFEAFTGRDLDGIGWIELEPDSTFCDQITATEDLMDPQAFKVFPNPANDYLTVEWDGMFYADIEIFNIVGHRIKQMKCSGGRTYLNTSDWVSGMYLITIDGQYPRKVIIQR